MTSVAVAGPVGPLVRDWRVRRRRTQLDLALEVGVSARHLSFVETGRSRPSPELILALGRHLEVPLRDQNQLLVAAGYAPRFRHTSLDAESMHAVRAALERILAGHDPYPGVVIDRAWNIVLANPAANRLAALLPAELAGPPLNVFRACLHPDGLAARTLNFPEWAGYLLGQLHRLTLISDEDQVRALAEEVSDYPDVQALGDWRSHGSTDEPTLLVPWQLDMGGTTLSLFTMVTTFGTPQDITLDELAVELFYPADAATQAALQSVS